MAASFCANELSSWLGALDQFMRERKAIEDALAEQWEIEDQADLDCDSVTISFNEDDLPESFIELSEPPFSIPIPPSSIEDQDNLQCLSLLIDIRDKKDEIDDLQDIHEMTPDVIDEAFDNFQDCVRHFFSGS